MSLRIVPIYHADANEFVRRLHRHNRPTLGAIFCVAVADTEVRGVAPEAMAAQREIGK